MVLVWRRPRAQSVIWPRLSGGRYRKCSRKSDDSLVKNSEYAWSTADVAGKVFICREESIMTKALLALGALVAGLLAIQGQFLPADAKPGYHGGGYHGGGYNGGGRPGHFGGASYV